MRTWPVSAAVVAATALVAAGCGSSSSSSKTSGSSKSKPAALTLNVANASAAGEYALDLVAQADGLFAKNNLKVNLTPAALSSSVTDVMSGQDDLGALGAALAFPVASNGQSIKMIANLAYNETPMLIGDKSVKSLAQAEQLKSCSIGTTPAGSANYAQAVAAVKAYHLACSIAQRGAPATIVPSVSSGRDQIGVLPPTFGYPAVSHGIVTSLLNPLNATAAEKAPYAPDSYPELAVFGRTSVLQQKRPAVVAFLKSLGEAAAVFKADTPSQLASLMLSKLPSVFPGQTEATLTLSFEVAKLDVPTTSAGLSISPALWQTTLTSLATWGLSNYSPTNPAFSYKSLVDMSYLTAANQ